MGFLFTECMPHQSWPNPLSAHIILSGGIELTSQCHWRPPQSCGDIKCHCMLRSRWWKLFLPHGCWRQAASHNVGGCKGWGGIWNVSLYIYLSFSIIHRSHIKQYVVTASAGFNWLIFYGPTKVHPLWMLLADWMGAVSCLSLPWIWGYMALLYLLVGSLGCYHPAVSWIIHFASILDIQSRSMRSNVAL